MDVRRASIFILLTLFLTSTLFAIEYVSGSISGVWGPENIIVIGDAYISAGSSLSISPGCTISFEDNYRITVNGTLQAVGTEENKIEFTALDTLAGWGGIRFIGSRGISTLNYCEFSFGHAGQEHNNGGSVFIDGGSIVEILNSLFHKNSAPNGSGGAIYCSGDAQLTLTKSNFANNAASLSGGAIYAETFEINLINNLIVNNEALSGGGVYIAGCDSTLLLNNTIYNNLAQNGGGLYLYDNEADVNIINNIVRNNQPDQAYVYETSCNALYNNISQDIGGAWDINAGPQFIRPTSGPGLSYDGLSAIWYLSPLSACIDAGIPEPGQYDLPDIDLLGNPRIYNNRVDIGAYEYNEYFVKADFRACGLCTGQAPHRVRFINLSYGNIAGYEWDFENDGLPDNNETHPRPTYNTWGKYTVKMIAYNSEIRDTFIRVDYVEAVAPVSFLPDSLMFSGNPYGQTYSSSFQITNLSDEVNINIRSMQLSKNENNAFSIINPLNNSDYITPGSSRTIQVSYNAGLDDDPPVSRGEIEIETDDNGYIYYRLIGSWESGVPVIDFEADVAQGIFPMTVNFLNKSRYGDNYYWDINNDGVIDSYSKDCSYTYTEPGAYSVSLLGSNNFGQASNLKTGYIDCVPRFLGEFYSLSADFSSLLNDYDEVNFGDTVFYKGYVNYPYFNGSSSLYFSSTLSHSEPLVIELQMVSDSVLSGYIILDDFTDISQNTVEITNDETIFLHIAGGRDISLNTESVQHSSPTVMSLYSDPLFEQELGNTTTNQTIFVKVTVPGTRALNIRAIISCSNMEEEFFLFQSENNIYSGNVNLYNLIPYGYGRCSIYPAGAENLGQEFLYYHPEVPNEPDSAIFVGDEGLEIGSIELGSEIQIKVNQASGEIRVISSSDPVGISVGFSDSIAVIQTGASSSEEEGIIGADPGGWVEVISFDGTNVYNRIDINILELHDFTLNSPVNLGENVDVFPVFSWQNSTQREGSYPQYQVFISTSPNFSDSLTSVYSCLQASFYPPEDLRQGTAYFWKVKAILGNSEIWCLEEEGYRTFTTISSEEQYIEIKSPVNSYRTLIKANSPYYIPDSLSITGGADLTIEPGVELLFEQGTGIMCGGNLYLNGQEGDSIRFSSISSGRWEGISFDDNAYDGEILKISSNYDYIRGNIVNHAIFSGAKAPISSMQDIYIVNSRFDSCSSGLVIGNNSVVKNSVIEDIDSITISEYAINGAGYIKNNLLRNISGSGIKGNGNSINMGNILENISGIGISGSYLVKANSIKNCTGIAISSQSNSIITGNIITDCGATAIDGGSNIYGNSVIGNESNGILGDSLANISGNIIENNAGFGIRGGTTLYGNIVRSNGLFGIWCHNNATLSENTVENCLDGIGIKGGSYLEGNFVSGCSEGGIFCSEGAELKGNTTKNNNGYGIHNGSKLTNNIVSGNMQYGIKCEPKAELQANTVSNNRDFGVYGGSIITNNTIDGNWSYGITCNGTAKVIGNKISNNTGFGIYGGNYIVDNIIENNGDYAIGGENNAIISNNNIDSNNGFAFHNAIEANNNTITANICTNTDLILFKGNTFHDNTISNNTNIDNDENTDSLGNYCVLRIISDTLWFKGNIINSNNHDDYNIFVVSTEGIILSDNIISGNSFNATASDSLEGCPLIIETDGSAQIIGNKFLDNIGGQLGGGFCINSADSVYIYNNIIHNNHLNLPGSKGGGVITFSENTVIDSNTFTANSADTGSAIYGRCKSIRNSIISNNIGFYAIYSAPESFALNNLYGNYNENDSIETNLYYNSQTDILYDNNFWGTRRVDGYIDMTIYDNDESNSVYGNVGYQPILTNPGISTQSIIENVDSVLITSGDDTQIPYSYGVINGNSVNICMIAEDPNPYSRDIASIMVLNLASNLSLNLLIRETDYNSGVFRAEIILNDTVYNPSENILTAIEGDSIRFQSLDDSTKVFYIRAISSGLIFPASISFDEDESIELDFLPFIIVSNPNDYVLTAIPSENIYCEVNGFNVLLSASEDWAGEGSVVFTITDIQSTTISDTVIIKVLQVNDPPVLNEYLPNIVMNSLSTYSLNLNHYFSDIDDSVLSYSASWSNINIEIDFDNGQMEISIDNSWSGEDLVIVNAIDSSMESVPDTFLLKVKSSYSITLNCGWNLISLPIENGVYDKTEIFPNGLEFLEYSGTGWAEPDYLIPGKGYWIRNSISQEVEFDYPPITYYSLQLMRGWNLVGALSIPSRIDTQNINSIWTFKNNSWQQVSDRSGVLEPGYGYWIDAENFMILELYPYNRDKVVSGKKLTSKKKPVNPFPELPVIKKTDKKNIIQ